MAASGGRAWAGWIAFAGTMLVLVGVLNVFQGFIALIWDERVVATPNNFVLVDLTSWGWTLLLFGLVMIAVGVGLSAAQTWARVTAVVIVVVHAASQIAWLGAYPVWALLMISLDTVVLFALTARWSVAGDDLAGYDGVGAAEGPGGPSSGRMAQAQGYHRQVS